MEHNRCALPPNTSKTIFILLLACATLRTVYAQSSSATIVGTVTDDSGAVIPDANVTVRSMGTGQESIVKRGFERSIHFQIFRLAISPSRSYVRVSREQHFTQREYYQPTYSFGLRWSPRHDK